MVRCSVINCKSDSLMKIDGLSFHSFPNESLLRRLWIAATGRINWSSRVGSKICSKHFDTKQIIKRGKKTFVYPDAVPISFLGIESGETLKNKSSEAISTKSLAITSCGLNRGSESVSMVPANGSTLAGTSKSFTPGTSPELTPETLKRKWQKSEEISEQRLKKLKAFREKSRRLTKKVADLEHVLNELQSKIR